MVFYVKSYEIQNFSQFHKFLPISADSLFVVANE